MRNGQVSSDVLNDYLDLVLRTPVWAGLVSSDPFAASDPLAVEIQGGAYSRPRAVFTKQGLLLRQQAAWTWRGIPATTRIVGVAFFNAAFNGRLRWVTYLPEPRALPRGGDFTLPAGSVWYGHDYR